MAYRNAEQRGTLPYFVRDNRERVKQAVGKEKVAIVKATESIKPTFNARVSRSKLTDIQDGYADVRDLIEQYKNISQKRWGKNKGSDMLPLITLLSVEAGFPNLIGFCSMVVQRTLQS